MKEKESSLYLRERALLKRLEKTSRTSSEDKKSLLALVRRLDLWLWLSRRSTEHLNRKLERIKEELDA